jgi:hypothetical protein
MATAKPISKRNAWQSRSLPYVRLTPSGAADMMHYLAKIPKDATGPVHFPAKLNYRKFPGTTRSSPMRETKS